MKRKVIQLAGKTLVISLPSTWVKKNGITKGMEMELQESEQSILIHNSNQKKDVKHEIHNLVHAHEIAYLYQAGVDEIKVKIQSEDEFKEITKKISDLMGYEIINQGKDFVEIKNVTNIMEEEFETILRRTFYLLEEMGKETYRIIHEEKWDEIHRIQNMEDTIDKFTDFCKRTLTKRGKDNKTQFYYTIIRDLEKIGDHYVELVEEKEKFDKTTMDYLNQVNNFLSLFHKIFYKNDLEMNNSFLQCKEKLKNTKIKDTIAAYNLKGLAKLIGNLYGPLYIIRI